jgi:hypothetical protein
MSKAYIITEVGFEYNDQYLYEPDCHNEHVYQAWMSQRMAEIECKRLNVEAICRDSSITNYGDDFLERYGGGPEDELAIYLESIGLNPEDLPYDLKFTVEQASKVYDLSTLRFYRVTEVEIQDD